MNTLAYTYFLKAYDAYPHDLAETYENLQLALSYDDCLVEANVLMGKMLAYQLGDYAFAMEYYRRAIIQDPQRLDTYVNASWAAVLAGEFKEAEGMILYAMELPSEGSGILFQRLSMVQEMRGQYREAFETLGKGIDASMWPDQVEWLRNEKKRVDAKLHLQKAPEPVKAEPKKNLWKNMLSF